MPPPADLPAGILDPAEVRRLFELVLGRPPEDEAVVRHYAAMNLSPPAFVRVLMDSEEVAERYRRRLALAALRDPGGGAGWDTVATRQRGGARVLLFGAYGNGNLGDAAQAEAVAWLLRALLPPEAAPPLFAATSWERRAAYPLPDGRIFPPDAAMRAELLPRSASGGGLLVIGGGGLLGAPHFPLHAEAWVDWLRAQAVPWALLGCGGSAEALAEPAWRAAYAKLISGAVFVGLRDADTLAAAQRLNRAACWFPDPILARGLLNPSPDPIPLAARAVDALVIPRTPNGPADLAANRTALAFAGSLRRQGGQVIIVSMEEVLDRGHFAAETPTYVDRWDALEALCRDARLVVSSRLHGVIAGLAAGCVVHGLLQPKIGELMARLGIGDWFAPAGWPPMEPDSSATAALAFQRAAGPGLARMRADLEAAMATARIALRAAARQ